MAKARAKKTSSFHDIGKRFATALLILPALFIAWAGGAFLMLAAIFVWLGMAYEIHKVRKKNKSDGKLPMYIVMQLAAFIVLVSIMFMPWTPWDVRWVFITALIITATDIGAFFTGRIIGGKQFAPRISPSKTWAGVCGGIVFGVVVALFAGSAYYGVAYGVMAVAGFGFAVLAIAGDLFESHFKRSFGVKDSGKLLPGHGGLLDRLDGYLFAMPALSIALNLGWL